eukprot:CAMPEP_0118857264 /NCGR_PEP_ID=MMETSP1163-20130328/4436_1 /TAXON_ID=124430 /ORGANISM="Phaeomonas parva, Strain CCMP2877" /LENGTH=441 /DNA_ID=CAMNT_0006790545 /DNA_START=133 /DNA_END=1455 /DNA_ORIENTATION=+
MSRSSLLREAQLQQQKAAEDAAFYAQQAAVAAGVAVAGVSTIPVGVVPGAGILASTREAKRNELPIHGNPHTYNLNTMLANLIVDSDYFRALRELSMYNEVVSEVTQRCKHAEPWATGTSRSPSTLFCLLFKAFTLRLTLNQMKGLINSTESPYLRCLGFLYLRYASPPDELWDWFCDYVDDPEYFAPSADPNAKTTVGEYVRKLLTDMKYYGTMLPRIPVKQERRIKMELVLKEENKERARANRAYLGDFVQGAKVRAIYSDADSAPAWYDAEIKEVHPAEASVDAEGNAAAGAAGASGEDPAFTVVFTEYGNEEVVGLGEIELPSKGGAVVENDAEEIARKERLRDEKFLEDRGYARRKKKRQINHPEGEDGEVGVKAKKQKGAGDELTKHLMKKVMQSDRHAVAARGRDYAARPASYKGSLSLKMDRYTHRKRSRSRS